MATFLNRSLLALQSLAKRDSKLAISDVLIEPDHMPASIVKRGLEDPVVHWCADRIARAREKGAQVLLFFGAHAVRNGLAHVMLRLAEKRFVTHFATNGAGSIHDWEIAYQGKTCEDVARGLAAGTFGLWDETGKWITLATACGYLRGLGFGEAIGAFIENGGLEIPEERHLLELLRGPDRDLASAAADLLLLLEKASIPSGFVQVPHPFKAASLQAGLYRLGVPLTVHVSIGQDIVHEHPLASGAIFGRASYRDFLALASSMLTLSRGVIIVLGSAVTGPMVAEKAFAMAQNIMIQSGRGLQDFACVVVDYCAWDWTVSEPPQDHPAYYNRAYKTFSRFGGSFKSCALDNRVFLCGLLKVLEGKG